jgi:hypothetical protein
MTITDAPVCISTTKRKLQMIMNDACRRRWNRSKMVLQVQVSLLDLLLWLLLVVSVGQKSGSVIVKLASASQLTGHIEMP